MAEGKKGLSDSEKTKLAEERRNLATQLVLESNSGPGLVLENSVIEVTFERLGPDVVFIVEPLVKAKWDKLRLDHRDALKRIEQMDEETQGWEIQEESQLALLRFMLGAAKVTKNGKAIPFTEEWAGDHLTEGDISYLAQAVMMVNTALPFPKELAKKETDGTNEPA